MYTVELMEVIKALAYGLSDSEIAANSGMDEAEVASIREQYAQDVADRKAALEGDDYCG